MTSPFSARPVAAPRVLLLNPPSPTPVARRFCGTQTARGFLYPPLELAQLGAIAREWHQAQVLLLDAVAEGANESRTLEIARGWRPDVAIVTPGFSTFRMDCGFARRLKEACGDALVGATGFLSSRHPARFLEVTEGDFVLLDEPEQTFSGLLAALAAGREPEGVEGLVWRAGDGLRDNGPRRPDDQLDRLPFAEPRGLALSPYRELLQPVPMWSVLTSRGCPYPCTFCVTTYGKTARFRSPANVAAEVEMLATRYGVRAVRFTDDTFGMQRERAMELCERLAALPRCPSWTTMARLELLDDQLIAAMVKAGCRRVDTGFESGSQRLLEATRKGIRASDMPARVERLRRAGLEVLGFFIVGFPGEELADLEASVELAIRSRLDYVVVTRLAAWPGTEMAGAPGLPEPADLFEEPPAAARAAWAERHFYRRFYFRPAYLLPRVFRFMSYPLQSLSVARLLAGYLLSSQELDYY